MCHHNSFLLYSAMERGTAAKWNQVTHVSVAASFLAMAALAVGGYVTFLDFTQGFHTPQRHSY